MIFRTGKFLVKSYVSLAAASFCYLTYQDGCKALYDFRKNKCNRDVREEYEAVKKSCEDNIKQRALDSLVAPFAIAGYTIEIPKYIIPLIVTWRNS